VTPAHGRRSRGLGGDLGEARRPRALVRTVQRAFAMKLAHVMAPSSIADDIDDPGLPGPARHSEDTEDTEPDALILDEFDPALSFRDAKERAITRWERWYVARLLEYTRGNLSEAARIAHSDRGHLRKLARKHLHWEGRSIPVE
jgi:DNA-binding NtrC family response regulator